MDVDNVATGADQVYIEEVNTKNLQNLFLLLLLLGLIYSFPIWLADRYYIDDLGRGMEGYTGWEKNGRFLASLITSALNFEFRIRGAHLIDISPLPQILAIITLAFAAALLGLRLFNNKVEWSSAIVVFPIIGSPYMLENLSYKFDSFSMATGLAAAIIAALNCKNRTADILLGSLLIIAAFSLYQASVNAFFGATALLLLAHCWKGGANFPDLILRNSIKFLLGYITYFLAILPIYPLEQNYSQARSVPISIDSEGARILLGNLFAVAELVAEYFSQIPVLTFFAIASVVLFGIRFISYGETARQKITRCFIFLSLLIILFFSIFGLLLFLKETVVVARTLLGFTTFLVFILYCYRVSIADRFKKLRYFLVVPFFYFYFVSFGYAAAAKEQSKYDFHLASRIIDGIEKEGFTAADYLIFDGIQPKSPILENSSRIKIINRLVQLHIANDWWWGYQYFRYLGLKFNTLPYIDKGILLETCTSLPILRSGKYEVYQHERRFLVSFEDGVCFGKNKMKDSS